MSSQGSGHNHPSYRQRTKRQARLRNVVAVLARIDDEIQWPLAKDEAAVKLDESHYFFTLRVLLAPLIVSIIAFHHCDPVMLISNQI
ncbi:hypothetical protein ACSBR1_026621 [Camellia fascicularis]